MHDRNNSKADSRQTDESSLDSSLAGGILLNSTNSLSASASPPEQPTPKVIESQATMDNTVVDRVDHLTEAVQKISSQIEDLTIIVKARLTYDTAKEEAFERLYADLEQCKVEAAQENIKPLLLDLILLFDRMDNFHREVSATDRTDGLIKIGVVKSFVDELLELLYRRDVSLIEVTSPAFDPNHQRAIGVEITAEPEQHHLVASVVRRGFRLGNRALRPEEVIVRRFVEPKSDQIDSNSGKTEAESESKSDG